MKFTEIEPPRVYEVGRGEIVRIKDCARIELAADEQVTFMTEAGGEYDVTRKAWGFYATPSLNARLPSFGLRAAMSRNPEGRYFVFLVEAGKEPEFLGYLAVERNVLVSWLDNDADLARLEEGARAKRADGDSNAILCVCGGGRFKSVHVFTQPPAGEIGPRGENGEYRREILRCESCGHFVGLHSPLAAVISGQSDREATIRVDASTPFANTLDAAARADRLIDVWERNLVRTDSTTPQMPRFLEVGLGPGACSRLLIARGWDCTVLDSDAIAVRYAVSVGLRAVLGDVVDAAPRGPFDLIALTRQVAEAARPARVLARALQLLKPGGCVYAELPDGETALRDGGPCRPEFFIENRQVFSLVSAARLAVASELDLLQIDRVREPGGRYILCLFLVAQRSGSPHE